MSDPKLPKDLKLKLGTKTEVIFTELKEATEKQIEGLEKSLVVNKSILELCKQKIEEEQKDNGK